MKRHASLIIFMAFATLFLAGCTSQKQINLVINSQPTGASVKETSLGSLGVTNFARQIDVEGKRYLNLEFQKEGYKSGRITIDMDQYKNLNQINLSDVKSLFEKKENLYTLELFLAKKPSTLRVHTKPSNAKVELICGDRTYDIHNEFDTSNIFLGNNALLCALETKAPGYETKKEPLRLQRFTKKNVDVVLQRVGVELTFTSKPDGASVYEKTLGYLCTTPCMHTVSGEKIDMISPNRNEKELSKASMSFSFTKPGYKTQSQSLLLDKSQKQTIQVILHKE